MRIDIIIPSPGESVTEVNLVKWLFNDGETVDKDIEIAEIDSDKATLSLVAPEKGVLNIIVPEGKTINVGSLIAYIETDVLINNTPQKKLHISPLAKKLIDDNNIEPEKISKSGDKIFKKDVLEFIQQKQSEKPSEKSSELNNNDNRREDRVKMSALRKKLSEKLVYQKNHSAMLTTFNEIDMSAVMNFRKIFGDKFIAEYGIKPGFVSFFAKAVTIALAEFPVINASIENDEIVYHYFADICIAISTSKGLMAPVIRNAELLDIVSIEKEIASLAFKAKENKISLSELSGGTFTITNGGTFGSMMSTPIINPPQSAILGMHKITDRPVVINGNIEIKPMMYVALSYDHRLIDGKDSVNFLVRIKDLIENADNNILTNNINFTVEK